MDEPADLARQIEANYRQAAAASGFRGADLWLTFYLCGPPEKLETIAGPLTSFGATNISGSESGFLYPKIPIRSEIASALEIVDLVGRTCADAGIEIVAIDLDTEADVGTSKFVTLFQRS
jgi:hypothetical protein